MIVSEEDHKRIAEAVASAERGVSGEIRCVLALETGNPAPSAMLAGLIAALVAPSLAALGGADQQAVALFQGWTAAHGAQASPPWILLGLQALLQVLSFAVVTTLALWRPLRRLLSPGPLVRARVRRAAVEQFESQGLTHTRDRTGVLLYASLADHRAEVLADSGIWDKTTPAEWQAVADALTAALSAGKVADGFVDAAGLAGALMRDRLPARPDDINELPDRLSTPGRPA